MREKCQSSSRRSYKQDPVEISQLIYAIEANRWFYFEMAEYLRYPWYIQLPLVEQKSLTLSEHLRSLSWCSFCRMCCFLYSYLYNIEHLSSPPDFSGVRVARSLVFCVMFCRLLFVLLSLFFWPLTLFVHLRFMASDYLPLVSSNFLFSQKLLYMNQIFTSRYLRKLI
jgi:hypothetical protein